VAVQNGEPAARRELTLNRNAAVLLLIGAAGFALRFVGLAWGLPYDLHPDESIGERHHPRRAYAWGAIVILLAAGERFADERVWYERLDRRSRVVQRIDGIGDLDLHHPTIEVRRMFCGPS